MTEVFEVRDHRNKAMFRVDDEYLNGYSKLCGVNSTMVYLCLCRHADRHQESFPSVKLMAEKTGISERSVIRGIQVLIEWNIISKERERKKDAKWLNNRYVLLDKSVWKKKPSDSQSYGSQVTETTEPHANDDKSHMPQSHTKVAHIKVAHTNNSEASSHVFNFEDYLKGMENHPRRDLQIIAFYFRETKTTYDSKEKASKGVARWLKVAQHLKPFSDAELVNAFDVAKSKHADMWNLETVFKKITK